MTNDLPANLSRSAEAALKQWGVDACRTAWREHHLHGEGPTVQSIQSGIPLRSVASAVNAYAEVWASLFPPNTPSVLVTTEPRWEVWSIEDADAEVLGKVILSTDSEGEARKTLRDANQYQHGLALVDRAALAIDWGDRITALRD